MYVRQESCVKNGVCCKACNKIQFPCKRFRETETIFSKKKKKRKKRRKTYTVIEKVNELKDEKRVTDEERHFYVEMLAEYLLDLVQF